MLHMNIVNQARFRVVETAALAIVVAFVFYIATVGSISAIGRHMEDGRLRWMRNSSVASAVLRIYAWPAQYLAVLPGLRSLLELSEDFWCTATDAPETTG